MTSAPEQPTPESVDDGAITAPSQRRPPVDPYIGLEIESRYRIERKLGAGGMGRVYLGKHLRTGASVAIKLVETHPARGGELQTRCFNEARAMMEVRSSHVAHAIDVGTLPHGELYLVLEYLRGEDLEALLRREGPLPWARLGPIALQLCSGLGSAHRQGIIHRDIKPSNCVRITIDDNPDHIKIIDFGIARDIDAPTGPTQQGTVIGTPEYLAPELVTGDARAGVRTDIYALGATLYKLLTGVSPFRGDSAFEVLGKHVLGERIPPSRAAPHLTIPASVDAIILRTLAAKPSDRFVSTDELAQAICAVLGTRRPGASGTAFSTPATAVLLQSNVASGEPRSGRAPIMGQGSTAETVAPRAIAVRAATLLATIAAFVVTTRLVMPADVSPQTAAGAPPVPAVASALVARPAPEPREPQSPALQQPHEDPRPAAAPAGEGPKNTELETPPPGEPALDEARRAPAGPDPPVADVPTEAKPAPLQPASGPQAPPPAPETRPPPSKPRPEPGFPYTAARSEIAQQLKYLRTTCMMQDGKPISTVKFRVDVAPSGTPNVRVYSGVPELRVCFRKALAFPFGKSPRGGAFVYTLTQSSAEFAPVPLEKAGQP